jgi:hypothetical protein
MSVPIYRAREGERSPEHSIGQDTGRRRADRRGSRGRSKRDPALVRSSQGEGTVVPLRPVRFEILNNIYSLLQEAP